MGKKTVYYIYLSGSSFVLKDINILQENYIVNVSHFNINAKWKVPFLLISQCFQLAFRQFDFVVIQFCGYHSFFPCLWSWLRGKKSVIVAGGTDCVSFPSIGYGNFNKFFLGLFTRWSYYLASCISPKHLTLVRCSYTYTGEDFPEQGIKVFCPGVKDKFRIIHNGYDSNFWKRNSDKNKKSFLTVTGGLEYPFQLKLKGIDLILEAAPFFPDCEFTIVGVPDHIRLPLKSSNVKTVGPLNGIQLIEYYSKALYYLQLSIAEGFPNALCEAMLCECIPVGSNVFSIPEIINNDKLILPKRDVKMLEMKIHEVLKLNPEEGLRYRERIMRNYSLDTRKAKLISLLHDL